MKADYKQKSSKRGKKGKISFDDEVISKDEAAILLSEQGETSISKNPVDKSKAVITKKNKKRKLLEEAQTTGKLNSKKKQLDNVPIEKKIETEEHINKTEQTEELTNKPKKESSRAQKRKKHADLLEQKKLKVDLELQQKALNYLSKWKHSKSEWKFEKLKQVWIQQNLFDASKIPDEFWETTVEYFIGAKGHARQVALDEALKIIEKEEESSGDNLDDYQVKLKRARTIVQNLQ